MNYFKRVNVILASVAVLLALGLAACDQSELEDSYAFAEDTDSFPAIRQRVSLPLGGGATLYNGSRLLFDAVGRDSRCPEGARCVHAGEVSAKFTLGVGRDRTTFALSLPGGSPAALPFGKAPCAYMHGVAVYLVRLDPYPAEAVARADGASSLESDPEIQSHPGPVATFVVRPRPVTAGVCEDGSVDA